MKFLSLIIFFSGLSILAFAQNNEDEWLSVFGDTTLHNKPISRYFLVRTKNRETPETLGGRGFRVLRHLSDDTYIVGSQGKDTALFYYSVPANAHWKLSPLLLRNIIGEQQKNKRQRFHLYSPDLLLLTEKLISLKDASIKIEDSYPGYLVISTTPEKLVSEVLPGELITFAESGERSPKEEIAIEGFDLTLNKVNLVHWEFPSINGAGITVSVKEQQMDTSDIDLKGRFVPGGTVATTVSNHATIMATMIGGAGNSFSTGKGVAWGTAFSSSSFSNLHPDADSVYRALKISVQNHSYGTGVENYYGADAAAYDSITILNKSLLHIFSSGNQGLGSSSSGTYSGITGYANLTGSFKMSKNSISVGATDAAGSIAPLSSRGPAHDGRVKPELVAFGEEGSSGGAAVVSGIAVISQHLYAVNNNGQLPDAALIKAILVNSADDVEAKGIDFVSGYGSVNAYRALQTINERRFISGMVARNEEKEFPLVLPSNAINLKITLAWTDPPAAANAFVALVNDLDLEMVTDTGNESWKPWLLNRFPHVDSLKKEPVRGRDSLNNLEQISIETPQQGSYILKVRAFNTTSLQQFFIAYQWDTLAHFKWTFPAGFDNLLPGQLSKIRWASSIPDTGELEYSPDAGTTWTSVNRQLTIPTGEFNWLVPDSFHVAMLRMVVKGKVYTSDTFTVSRPLNTGIGFNCSDSLQIYWNSTKQNHYVLYQLGERYLEPAGVYHDSSAVIIKSAHPSLFYSVAPILSYNRTGAKSYALNYTSQGVACYFRQFIADLEGSRALIQFSLGSLHNIQDIALQKLNGNSFETIRTFPPLVTHFSVYDSGLTRGVNTYRVKISFPDGRQLYSQLESVIYFIDSDFVIYPNPVIRGQQLQVLSKDPDGVVIRCFSMDGKMLIEKTLTNTAEPIRLPLSQGIYLLEILRNGKRELLQKLVVY